MSARHVKAKTEPRTIAQKAAVRRRVNCTWCGHAKSRHTAGAGCLGDGGPGANCSCDEYTRAKLPDGDL